MAESNNAEKIMMIGSDARDLSIVLKPNSYTPSWPQDMVINNCNPYKGEKEKHVWTDGEHSQGDFNAAVTLEGSGSGGTYCTIM